MRSKLTPQKIWLLVLIAFVLVNAGVWMYGLAPTIDKIDAAKAHMHTTEGQRDSLQQRLDQLNAIDTVALEDKMSQLNLVVPEQGFLREFITELERVALQHGVLLAELSISEPSIVEPYLLTSISMELVGQYSGIIGYLKFLEEHERLLLVDNFSLEAGDIGIECTINIVIFAEDFDEITPHDAPGRDNPFGAS